MTTAGEIAYQMTIMTLQGIEVAQTLHSKLWRCYCQIAGCYSVCNPYRQEKDSWKGKTHFNVEIRKEIKGIQLL